MNPCVRCFWDALTVCGGMVSCKRLCCTNASIVLALICCYWISCHCELLRQLVNCYCCEIRWWYWMKLHAISGRVQHFSTFIILFCNIHCTCSVSAVCVCVRACVCVCVSSGIINTCVFAAGHSMRECTGEVRVKQGEVGFFFVLRLHVLIQHFTHLINQTPCTYKRVF